LIRTAVGITPGWVREILRLNARCGLSRFEPAVIRMLGPLGDRVVPRSSPPVEACRRLGAFGCNA
jgi:hypothetical protein